MAAGTLRKLCISHSLFNGADFCGEGTGHFRSSGEQRLEVDLEQTQNYCVELIGSYAYAAVFDDLSHGDSLNKCRMNSGEYEATTSFNGSLAQSCAIEDLDVAHV